MPYLQKVIVIILSISFCLTNFSLALGATYAVDNPGWRTFDYTFTSIPSDAKINNVRVNYAYSHCPHDYVTIKLSKNKNDAAPIILVQEGVSQYITKSQTIWNSPVDYFKNSKANDVWTLRMDITGNACYYDPNCSAYYNGHSASFSPGDITITYDHAPPTVISPVNRFFSGSSSINFQWSSLPNADIYKITLLDNSDFSKEEPTASTSFNTSSDSTLQLQPMHKYYWSVAGANAVGTGLSSETRSFIIGQAECWPEVGFGVGAVNGYDHFDTCYVLNSSPVKYLMKDISRRENMNVDGHNGRMSSTASILTQLYNASGPMDDPDNLWWDSGQESGVDAHVNAGKVYDYLLNHLTLNSYDKNGSSMTSIVEYGDCYNNAMWNGSFVRYCVGFPYSSKLDVVGHEWAHAVTQKASNRQSYLSTVDDEAGALDEAFSDWFGAAVALANGSYNWIHADGAPFFRNFANPKLSQPPQPGTYGGENWSWANEVHTNCGVPNKMFKILSDAIGVEKATQIAYKANMERWQANLTFAEARDGMIKAAEKDFGPSDVEQVKNAWAAVHVTEMSTPDMLNAIRSIVPAILLPLLLNL